MIVKCFECGTRYETKRNDPTTWGCPCAADQPQPVFTVAPQADKTKFVSAKKETP